MSYARVVVADKTGRLIAELKPDLIQVSWRISKVGKAHFTLSSGDSKATRDILRFGNRLLIQFENGLPNWVGVMNPPRAWKFGEIEVTAYSAESLFQYRITNKSRVFTGVTAGTMYRELITEMNRREDTGITIGDLWLGGQTLSADFHYEDLLDIFQEHLTLAGGEFNVTGDEINGYLVLFANFYERMGKDRTGTALVEGANVKSAVLKEVGPIINSQTTVGKGTDWGDDRLTSTSLSQISIDEFGLRQEVSIYSSETLQSSLDIWADIALLDTLVPYNAYMLDVLDEDPGEFRAYGVGDDVTLSLPNYGFGGTDAVVRVIAREYKPAEGQALLIVQEQ
ncbi:MAG: hypothetical protein ACW99U_20880 [Candidatus Thorarchaeota archaeon]